jgi:hypothetical protein
MFNSLEKIFGVSRREIQGIFVLFLLLLLVLFIKGRYLERNKNTIKEVEIVDKDTDKKKNVC